MPAIAHLPMYDLPEVRPAADALWQAIGEKLRAGGVADVPRALSRRLTHQESWRHPGLLLGQSCGYPALHQYRDRLRIIAAPIHDAPGCSGTMHCSFIVVRSTAAAQRIADLRGARFALNAWDSNTGMNLARLAFAPFASGGRFLGEIVESGGHAASLASVAAGEADAAATIHALRDALAAAIADPALAASRETLFLTGMAPADAADYAILIDYEDRAANLSYPLLA
jgi:hypothetical protein